MSSYIINVKNTSDEEGTVIADVGFSYSDNLNDINEAQLRISGTGETKRGLFEIGSEVKIYRNGTLGFHGIINGISYLDGGGISADVLGYESWLAKENGEYASSPYSATASATIAGHIIGESNYFTAGTVEAGANIDFRIEATDSLYNALSRMIKRVGQDIGINYATSKVNILNHKGSSTSVATLNDGIQVGDMVVRKSYPIGNDVRVFGKSEGSTRVKSNPATYGQNADSKTTYGTIRKDYIDNSVTSAGEANALADQLVAKYKDPVKVYEFDVLNPNQSLVSGDVITLNSKSKGLSAEEVRIVGLKRGVDANREFLTIEVTNKEYSTKTRSINQKIAELENQSKNLQTYDSYHDEYSNRLVDTTIGGVIDVGTGLGAVGMNPSASNTDFHLTTGGSGDIWLSPGTSGRVYVIGLVGMHLGNNPITNLSNPTNAQDAATKYYVDTVGGGWSGSATSDLDMNDYEILDCDKISGDEGFLDLDFGADVKLKSYDNLYLFAEDDLLLEAQDTFRTEWGASGYALYYQSYTIYPVAPACYLDLGTSSQEFDRIYCDDIYGDAHATTCDVAELQFVEEGVVPGDIVELGDWDSDEEVYFKKELEECSRKQKLKANKGGCKLKFFGMQGKWKKAQANSTKCPSIISTQPGIKLGETELRKDLYEKGRMNWIALSGSVPNVHVVGEFHAGDMLVSAGDGKAKVDNNAQWNQVIGHTKRSGKDERTEVWTK